MADITETPNHTERAHARLSPSGASRWLNCTAAPSMEDGHTDQSSESAREGTLAHEFAEIAVLRAEKVITPSEYRKKHSALKKHELYNLEMNEHVAVHRDYIKRRAAALRKIAPTEVHTEMKVYISEYVPDCTGLSDNIIYCEEGTLEIVDFKYGKFFVEVQDNAQLRLYALGAMEYFSLFGPVHTITMTIVQPRADNIASHTVTPDELRAWGESIKEKASAAHENRGTLEAGNWCKFCKAKAVCKEHARALQVFTDTPAEDLDPRKITVLNQALMYASIDRAKEHIEALETHMLSEALKGVKYKGLKVVRAGTKRKIANPANVINLLTEKGFKAADFMDVKLKAIGALEKLVSKKVFDLDIGAPKLGHIVKPQGGPTLAPDSDPRPAFKETTAAEDFGAVEDSIL